MLGKIQLNNNMRKKIVAIISFLVIVSYALCQKETFFNKFKTIELPFKVNFSTFDIYASENNVKLNERDVEKYLLSETDDFLIRKSNQKLKQNTYYDYFSVGKIKIKSLILVLYYRNYTTISENLYIELMACVFDTKSNLLKTISLSKFDTQLGIYSFCEIKKEGEIIVYYLTKGAVDAENLESAIIRKIHFVVSDL